jgi:hypothetical protein
MSESLKSRKLWVSAAGILTVLLQELFGIDISPESIVSLAVIVGTYVIGQAQVDKAKVVEDARNYARNLEEQIQGLVAYLQSIQADPAQTPEE